MSSSLPQVLILAAYFLGRSCKIARRTRGAYLVGEVGGGGIFLAMVKGTIVALGMAEIEDEKYAMRRIVWYFWSTKN